MRRVPAENEKPLHWVGSSKRDFLSFPAAVKEDMGNALGIAQFGGTWPTASRGRALVRACWKRGVARRKRVSSGVHGSVRESRVRPARLPEEVAVWHSNREADVDLVSERLKTAARDYEEHYGKPKR